MCGLSVVAGVGHEDANCRRQVCSLLVQVLSRLLTLDGGGAAQLELLADLGGEALQDVVRGLAVHVCVRQLLLGVRLRCCCGVSDLCGDVLELLVLGHEVGLGVDLDDGVAGDGDQALEGVALCALAHVLGALDAEVFDGLIEVAAGLLECLLAVEHAGTGGLAELLDVSSSVVRHSGRSSS